MQGLGRADISGDICYVVHFQNLFCIKERAASGSLTNHDSSAVSIFLLGGSPQNPY
ncbi:unnamed protein product, partial [Staurois parvus]